MIKRNGSFKYFKVICNKCKTQSDITVVVERRAFIGTTNLIYICDNCGVMEKLLK